MKHIATRCWVSRNVILHLNKPLNDYEHVLKCITSIGKSMVTRMVQWRKLLADNNVLLAYTPLFFSNIDGGGNGVNDSHPSIDYCATTYSAVTCHHQTPRPLLLQLLVATPSSPPPTTTRPHPIQITKRNKIKHDFLLSCISVYSVYIHSNNNPTSAEACLTIPRIANFVLFLIFFPSQYLAVIAHLFLLPRIPCLISRTTPPLLAF